MNRIKIIIFCILFSNALFATSCEVSDKRPPLFNRTLDTIGDSIISSNYGQNIRCLLHDYKLQYDFSGSFIDIYGFKHDGKGGQTSSDILKRIDTIPVADSYFILIGINDIYQSYSKEVIVSNIKNIAKNLSSRNHNCIIYISTLLPVHGSHLNDVMELNYLLNLKDFCSQCKIIDLGGYFYNLNNWESYLIDGVHPNLEGYQLIAKYLSNEIN